MPSVRKALALSFAGKYSALAIHTVAVMVLARLLTPAEIGVYSVGAAVVGLAHVVRDFGVGNYLIQEKELTTERIRTAFAVTLVIGWTMAAVLFGLSGPVSDFYDEPGLRRVLRVLCLTFFVIPFGAPILALLQRDMAFGRIYVVEVTSAAAHVTTGITLAALGYGFMSLAWASLAGVVATATVAAFYRPSVARSLPSFKAWRRVLSFGSYASAAGIVTQIGMNANDLILGRMLGFTAVGLYSRAQGLVYLFHRNFMDAIHTVALPSFSAGYRADEKLKLPYLQALSNTTAFAWPFYIFLAAMALPIIRVLFGHQWDDAVPLVQWLCLSFAIAAIAPLTGSILIAFGEVKALFITQLTIQCMRIFLIVIAALWGGLVAVASAQVIVYIAYILIYHPYLVRLLGIHVQDIFRATRISILVSASSSIVPLLALYLNEFYGDITIEILLLCLFGSAASWLFAIFLFNHTLKEEIVLAYRRPSVLGSVILRSFKRIL